MLDRLRTAPLLTSLALVAIYFVIFIVPGIFSEKSYGRGRGLETATDATGQLPLETALLLSIVAVIALLGWWRATRIVTPLNPGGLKFLVPPLLLSFAIAGLALIVIASGEAVTINHHTLLLLFVMTLFVGIFEELLFRGCVFHGLERWRGPITAVFVSAALFGAMHYVNWVNGQPLPDTNAQVIHAAGGGILYAAIMLRTGSIWPAILLHGFWDSAIFLFGFLDTKTAAPATPSDNAGGPSILAGLIKYGDAVYGLFVLWCWWRWKKKLGAE
ncbi:MAG: CPBP family intramembrane glutamic endopeptidase [Pseudomonadota bacterium]